MATETNEVEEEDEEEEGDGEVDVSQEEIEELLDENLASEETIPITEVVNASMPLTPLQQAILAKEKELAKKVTELESLLRVERVKLTNSKDKVSESGKNGFFFVQAQVAEFLKKKDAEQKKKVNANKRDFVVKVLPLVDAFRQAPISYPAQSEKEQNMHNSFGTLLNGISIVIDKYGFKEFYPKEGDKLDSTTQQIEAVEVGDAENVVLRVVRPGMYNNDGEVLRKAVIIASAPKEAVKNSEEQKVNV